MKFLKWVGIIVLALILVYFLGPHPSTPKYSAELIIPTQDLTQLDDYIINYEAGFDIKPDNEARIVWNNKSLKNITEYAVVYLHGFSASQKEGDPVHLNFARKFGCNLYLSRLSDHGLKSTEPLIGLKAEKLWNSARAAYAIGTRLGRKVIIMATSTGGTLALKLAAEFPEITALILLSPNIEINDSKAWILNNPWGLQIAKLIKGKYNYAKDTTALYAKYWDHKYRVDAVVQLEELLETTMKESTFQKVRQPTLLLYYYKDEEHQDPVVKVSAMKRMFVQLGTNPDLKRQIAIPEAGDHVIGSYIKSKDVKSVMEETEKFALEVLHLKYSEKQE
jgi:esterase/lipase